MENLIRFYGDGNTKARATPSMDVVHVKKAGGVCVITGEDVAGSLSSQLRCLFLSVEKGTYDGKVLQRFQDAPYRWTEYLELFTRKLFEILPNLLDLIKDQFPICRKLAETKMKERRLIDICAALILVTRIVLKIASQLTGINLIEQYRNEFTSAVFQIGMESEGRAKRQNPAKIFATVLQAMLQRKDVRIAEVENFIADPKAFLGVKKDNHLYLWPNETFRLVVQYYEAGGQTFPLTQNALWAALAAEEVLIPTQTSRGKEYGTKVPFGSRPRLLKIVPQRLAILAEYG